MLWWGLKKAVHKQMHSQSKNQFWSKNHFWDQTDEQKILNILKIECVYFFSHLLLECWFTFWKRKLPHWSLLRFLFWWFVFVCYIVCLLIWSFVCFIKAGEDHTIMLALISKNMGLKEVVLPPPPWLNIDKYRHILYIISSNKKYYGYFNGLLQFIGFRINEYELKMQTFKLLYTN